MANPKGDSAKNAHIPASLLQNASFRILWCCLFHN